MAKVHRTIQDAKDNLKAAAPNIPARYKSAVSKADWEAPTSSSQSEENYQAGVADAIAKGTRVAGIHRAGNAGWRTNAMDKGGAVIGTRIAAAIEKYGAAFAPVLSAMNSAADAVPPKTRDPMQNIELRLKPVVLAAIAAKKS